MSLRGVALFTFILPEVVPLGVEYRRWGQKTRVTGLQRAAKEVLRYLQPCGYSIHQRDGRTPGDSKDRAYA